MTGAYNITMGRESNYEIKDICKRLNIAISHSPYEGYSLRKIAPLFSRSHTTVKRWLSGEAMPSFVAAQIICNVLQISFEWLFTGKGLMEKGEYTLDEMAIIEIFRRLSDDRQREYIKFGYMQMSRYDAIEQQKSHKQALLTLISRDQK